jgi:uncharacterized membrane protein YdjX (TVP38/TMEM64 family)
MRDTLITGKGKKRELIIFAICVLAAILVNVYAIVSYDTRWSELYSMVGMVVAIAVFFYLAQWILRLIFRGMIRLYRLVAG